MLVRFNRNIIGRVEQPYYGVFRFWRFLQGEEYYATRVTSELVESGFPRLCSLYLSDTKIGDRVDGIPENAFRVVEEERTIR